MFPGAISSHRAQKIDSTPKPLVQPLARRGVAQPMWTTQRFNRGMDGRRLAFLGAARRFSARCKPGVTDALLSAIYRRGVWKGTNASRTKIRFFFGVRNWMCGVRACENMQKRVSHGETVRVGSSESGIFTEINGIIWLENAAMMLTKNIELHNLCCAASKLCVHTGSHVTWPCSAVVRQTERSTAGLEHRPVTGCRYYIIPWDHRLNIEIQLTHSITNADINRH